MQRGGGGDGGVGHQLPGDHLVGAGDVDLRGGAACRRQKTPRPRLRKTGRTSSPMARRPAEAIQISRLRVGAKILGPPALDREFRTIDFLTFIARLHGLDKATGRRRSEGTEVPSMSVLVAQVVTSLAYVAWPAGCATPQMVLPRPSLHRCIRQR